MRSLDSAANPYIAYAVILGAGLKGIAEGYELPPAAEDNVWSLTEGERRAMGYQTLPQNLDVVGVPTADVTLSAPTFENAASTGGAPAELTLFFKLYDLKPDGTIVLAHRLIAPVRIADFTHPLHVDTAADRAAGLVLPQHEDGVDEARDVI